MKLILRPGFLLAVVAFGVAPVAARAPQPAKASLPAARTVIDRYIKEIGGREAVLAQTSSHMIGTVAMPAAGLTGTVEAFHAKPNKSLQRISLPGIGQLQEGF